MKRVENTPPEYPWEIDTELVYRDEEDGDVFVRVCSYEQCNHTSICHAPCCGYVLIDQDGERWCPREADFIVL